MSFKESIKAALSAYLGSENFSVVMSSIKALDFTLFGRKRSPAMSFLLLFSPTQSPEEKEAYLHLRNRLVKIVQDNCLSKLFMRMISHS